MPSHPRKKIHNGTQKLGTYHFCSQKIEKTANISKTSQKHREVEDKRKLPTAWSIESKNNYQKIPNF